MYLKVIMCMVLFLMSSYGYGEGEDGARRESIGMSGKERHTPSENHNEQRESSEDSLTNSKWFVVSGSVGFLSNYLYRGMTESFGGPAVQGELVISQKKEEGLFASIWGSSIDSTTATNGSGIELLLSGGYIYKANEDLSLKLEIRDTIYPKAYNPGAPGLPITNDSYNMFEIVPGFTYKYFTFIWAYQVSNVSGINQNFVQTFFVPLDPHGNTKGSWYAEGSVNWPILCTEDKLKFKLLAGYWHIKNYSAVSYAVFGTGFSYEMPEKYGGVILSVNASTTTGNKKYWTNVNVSGKAKYIGASTVWVGIMKRF